jgi:hypothetical protein
MNDENNDVSSVNTPPSSRVIERDGRKMGGFGRQIGRNARVFGGKKTPPLSPTIMAGVIAIILIGFAAIGTHYLF